MRWCREKGFVKLATFISWRLQSRGVFISPFSNIHPSTQFPHPTSIVIGEGVIIDENVRVYQNVTLGGARIGDWKANNYPKVGAGTVIFAGSVVIGDISIGKNCVIGANSVVLKSVPDNAVCVGAPAKVIYLKESAEFKSEHAEIESQ